MEPMIQCITLDSAWYDGVPVEIGTTVSLSESEATYAETIHRVARVPPDPPE